MSNTDMHDIRSEWQLYDDAMRMLVSVQRNLSRLSDAFDRTGNERVAEELSECANLIERAYKDIRDHVSGQLTQRVRYAERSSFTLLKGVMAGAGVSIDDA